MSAGCVDVAFVVRGGETTARSLQRCALITSAAARLTSRICCLLLCHPDKDQELYTLIKRA